MPASRALAWPSFRLHRSAAPLIAVAALAASSIAALSPRTAEAQRPISLSVSGGGVVPGARLGHDASNGYLLGAGLGLAPSIIPLGFTLDANYMRLGDRDGRLGASSYIVRSLTLNAVFGNNWSRGLGAVPYVTLGGGYFDHGGARDATQRVRDPGVALAVGLAGVLNSVTTFAELRYYHIITSAEANGARRSVALVPIVVGLRF
jgi:hypothetical protein